MAIWYVVITYTLNVCYLGPGDRINRIEQTHIFFKYQYKNKEIVLAKGYYQSPKRRILIYVQMLAYNGYETMSCSREGHKRQRFEMYKTTVLCIGLLDLEMSN